MVTATQHKLIGATVRATNRTHGLIPAQPYGDDEIVTEIVNEYDMTIRTDQGNVYPNGDYLVMRHAAPAQGEWVPINDYPGDQQYDAVPGTAKASYWGTIGLAAGSGGQWSWTINATDDFGNQWEPAGGTVDTETEAKRAVEQWRPTTGAAPVTEGSMEARLPEREV